MIVGSCSILTYVIIIIYVINDLTLQVTHEKYAKLHSLQFTICKQHNYLNNCTALDQLK